jgi:hypothetical protein
MLSVSRRASRAALMSCLLLCGPSAFAQVNPAWVDPIVRPGDIAAPEPAAKAAHALAVDYLDFWSAPNRLTLAAASSFYGSTVTFHGRERTLDSVLAEKRRFAERWPQRTYRYRPETTMVACESDGARCTVWAIFDFSAADAVQSRRSLGIGEHELVVSLSNGRPVIVSETSRVLHRGAVKNH